MSLALFIQDDYLSVKITNTDSQFINLWEEWNYWGWGMISFILKDIQTNNEYFISRKIEREWTENFPSYINIEPGESINLKFDIKDNYWLKNEGFESLKGKKFKIKAILQVKETPEAKKYQIYTGRIESDWIISYPPHNWLFADYQLQLKFIINSDSFIIRFFNISDEIIKIWKFDNAWGWELLSFVIRTEEKEYKVNREIKYSEKKPDFIAVKPGRSYKLKIKIKNSEWDFNSFAAQVESKKLHIRAVYESPVYSETKKYQIFSGTIKSNWAYSEPPHKWLY